MRISCGMIASARECTTKLARKLLNKSVCVIPFLHQHGGGVLGCHDRLSLFFHLWPEAIWLEGEFDFFSSSSTITTLFLSYLFFLYKFRVAAMQAVWLFITAIFNDTYRRRKSE